MKIFRALFGFLVCLFGVWMLFVGFDISAQILTEPSDFGVLTGMVTLVLAVFSAFHVVKFGSNLISEGLS